MLFILLDCFSFFSNFFRTGELICLARGLPLRVCVSVRGGLMLRKQITNRGRVKVTEKNKRVSKRATAMQARKPTVDLGSEKRRVC